MCDAKYSLNPKVSLPLNSDQWGLWYDYDVQWLVPCLAALGFTASQPPSRETFIAQGLQNGSPVWMPWSEADYVFSQRPWDEQVVFIQTCPADPPEQYMWGD